MATKTKTVKAHTVKLGNRYLKEKVKGEERSYNFVKNPLYASLFEDEEKAKECLGRFLANAATLAEIKKQSVKVAA